MTNSQDSDNPAGAGGEAPPAAPAGATTNISAMPLAVVGVGASAGGLDAFKRLLKALSPTAGMAFVLVPHLDPSHESLMAELLSRHTSLPVREASDSTPVEPNRVYVIPPNHYLAIGDGKLKLTALPDSAGRETAIDFFLRSLADAYGDRAIGIILSGTGSHGTVGLQAIKAQNGLTLVQHPDSAEYGQMPQSAIAAGLADYVLLPEDMPKALESYAEHARRAGVWSEPVVDEEPRELIQILALLRARTKYDFRAYRKKMLLRRVQRRMSVCHVDTLGEYLARLRSDDEEPGRLFRDLLIGVTAFFREPEAFKVLEQRVAGPLLEQADPDAPIRVWVPGCSTGEEAYSIAILLLEGASRRKRSANVQIFATDIDEEALEIGRQGLYPESIVADVSPDRLKRFFTKAQDRYQVNKQLRETVVFAPQNLISDAPFSRLDLISCRNLLIYLEASVQRKLIALFHFALKEGGHLFLGTSESVGHQSDLFETVSKKWRLFRRVGTPRRDLLDLPIGFGFERSPYRGLTSGHMIATVRDNLAELTRRTLLDDYAPAAVLTSVRNEVLYFFGPTTNYLQLPSGEPTRDLLSMAREGLRSKLRAACQKVLRDRVTVVVDDATVKRGDAVVPVQVRVKPVRGPDTAADLLLVTFSDRPHIPLIEAGPKVAGVSVDEASAVQQLELELKVTREELQNTIEEMESANEELKASNEEVMSMNEELQSANEELETSKEELQSLNEELSTVNSQLQEKVEELEHSNNDITNLLTKTDITTVFLDPSLRIKLFTPPSARLFNLRPSDVGRPLSHFSPNFDDERLLADAEAVLEKLSPLDQEVRTNDGRHLIRRIQPYRTQDNRIDGVVITFIDITARIDAERITRDSETQLRTLNKALEQRIEQRTAELAKSKAELSMLADNVPAMYSYVDAGEVYRYVNRLYQKRWNLAADQIVGKTVLELMGPERYAAAKSYIDGVLAGEPQRYEHSFDFEDGRCVMDVLYVPDKTDDGSTQGFYVLVHDITERKALESRLHDNEQHLRAIVDTAADGIVTVDRQGIIRDFNPAAERMFGLPADSAVNRDARVVLPPGCKNCTEFPACFRNEKCTNARGGLFELTGLRRDGTTFPMEIKVSEIDHLGLYVVLARDVSERKHLEKEIIDISTLEQERIGRDIHDGIGQQLTGLAMLAHSIEQRLGASGRTDEAAEVGKLVAHLQDTLEQTRALARGLAPVEIDPAGLADALARLARDVQDTSGVNCRFQETGAADVPDKNVALHLYRIAQEAIHNAVRHGHPRNIEVRLSDHDLLRLSIQDDGIGIQDADTMHGGLGVRIMRYRAGIIGGRLRIEPAEGGGTRVVCTVPLSK